MLYSSLNPTKDINYVLYTGRINQVFLENLFCTFHQQQCNNYNPTPIQLSRTFRKIFCLNFFQTLPGANCILDLDQILCSEIATDEFLSIRARKKSF